MGFGLMGAGAAVSGLMSGYQQGRKFAQDEERFEMEREKFGLEKEAAGQRKRLADEQIKGASLLNRRAEGELGDVEYNRSIEADERAIVERYAPLLSGASQAPAAPPSAASVPGAIPDPAAGSSAPEAVATPGGIPVPGQQPAQPPKSRFEVMRDMNTELLNNRLRMRGVDRGAILKQAVESAKFFNDAKTKTTLGALNAFAAGVPQEEILADLVAQGIQVQPGTSFAVVDKKDPRTGVPIQDIELRLPGGRVISKETLSEQSLDAKQMFDIRTEIGKLNATVSHHAAMESLAREANADKRASYAEQIKRLDAQIAQQARSFSLQEAGFAWNKFTSMKDSAERSFARTFNYAPPNDLALDKLREQDIKEPIEGKSRVDMALERAAKSGGDVTMAMLTWATNLDPKTMKPNATEAEVVQALRTVQADRSKVKYDDLNRAFVDVSGTKVLVPLSRSGQQTPEPQGRVDRSRSSGLDYEKMPLAQLASAAGYSQEARRVYERRTQEAEKLKAAPGFWKGSGAAPAAPAYGLDPGR